MPTFWMMPDRGESAGPQGKRADTGNGGMELDIMERIFRLMRTSAGSRDIILTLWML
jgi:hypothetical protein